MEISSSSHASSQRAVTPSKSSSDRQSNDDAQAATVAETKAQDRAQQQRKVQDNLQQRNEEDQRRLDGRLISFGREEDSVSNEQKQASFNRSRVNDAYSPPKNEASNSQMQQNQASHHMDADAIDIVV